MTTDEESVRAAIALWHRATAAGDVQTVIGLMAEDATFLVCGRPPMRGRGAFEQGFRALLQKHRIESSWNIQEISVSADLAYAWVEVEVTIVPLAGGDAATRTGNAMSIFSKHADGAWLLLRDANLLPPP